MPRDLRDLKKFKGNDYGADFVLFPVDRKKTVEDIPNLEPHEVNVCAWIGDKNVTGNRKRLVKLIRVDKLAPPPQFEQLYKILAEKNKECESKPDKNSAETLGMESTLHDLIDTFLVEKAWEFKEFEGYKQRLGWWKNHISDLPLDEVTTNLIKSKKTVLKKEGHAGATVNRYVSCLQGAFRWGIDAGWITVCPISNKKVSKEPEVKRLRWLDDNELKKLFAALDHSESKNLKDMVHFALNTGCRKSEALGLRWKDVDFTNNQIFFRVVKRKRVCTDASFDKNGKAVFVTKTQVFEEGLKNGDNVKVQKLDNMPEVRNILIRRRGNADVVQSDKVFPNNIRRSWDKLLKRIGLEDFRWHDLRHCCASYMRQDGKSLGHIGNHLGQRSAASSERYSHLSGEETLETGASITKRLYG